MFFGIITMALFGSTLLGSPNAGRQKNKDPKKEIMLTEIGRYETGACTPACTRAEIAAYDPATKRLFAINANQLRLDVLDISTSSNPVPAFPPISLGTGLLPTASRSHDGIVAVALQVADPNKTSPGVVKFLAPTEIY